LKQIKLTGNRHPTVRHSGGGGHSLEILPRAPEIIDPPLVVVLVVVVVVVMCCCRCRLSGLSPFAGESDAETLANVTAAEFDFDDEEFNDITPAAKHFIEKLLVKQPRYVQYSTCVTVGLHLVAGCSLYLRCTRDDFIRSSKANYSIS